MRILAVLLLAILPLVAGCSKSTYVSTATVEYTVTDGSDPLKNLRALIPAGSPITVKPLRAGTFFEIEAADKHPMGAADRANDFADKARATLTDAAKGSNCKLWEKAVPAVRPSRP